MMTLTNRAFVVGAALGLGCAVTGCTTTTSIRPDQLPLLTDAAAGPGRSPPEVISASGRPVRLGGTLEDVEVSVAIGTGMVLPGIFLTRSGARKLKYPPRPVSSLRLAPGALRLNF